jgi:hypothetical protein
MYTPSVQSHHIALQDPAVISAARGLYEAYVDIHQSRSKEPVGVVVHQFSGRSQLSFRPTPVLLPEECFVPLQHFATT